MSGFLIQSRFGSTGNFEVAVPNPSSPGLIHFWRNNDDPSFPWSGPTTFGGSLGNIDGGVSLMESNFGSPGNLEVVVSTGGQLFHFWRDSGPSFAWNGPFLIDSGVSGIPGLIQSNFGTQGNFEVVAPSAGVGLVHYWRNNDDPNFPWIGPTAFGDVVGGVDSVSLIQSNFGPGNLEVVASAGGQVYHFWRDAGPSFTWNGPFQLGGILGSSPSLIQSRFGTQGNFEMVVSTPASGGLAHFWRDNDDPNLLWNGPTPFGVAITFGAASLIQSSFGSPGNLEVIAGSADPGGGGELVHFWRDSGPSFSWNGPIIAESGL